ncbi:unnamed protein product [Polarella glacialis]|uniref:Uncharacterized protein n=1 Tax=Polarella glacialis TaxID=89957 RepID=A0A813EZ33_POLGL|nr:unnamed protein product [Polarella glacialis]
MLGTMVAFQACDIFCGAGGSAAARISAGTDNQANDSLSKKMPSTKRPLRLILRQLTTPRSRKKLQLNLDWRPREENQEADDLTNGKFEDPTEEHRVNFTWEEVDRGLIEKLLICQCEHEVELAALKSRAAAVAVEGPMSKRRKKDDKTVWG